MFGCKRPVGLFGCSIGLALCLLGYPARGRAQDEATLAAARQLGQEGVALYQSGDYAAASDKLERAYAVVKVPTLGLWSGRAFEQLGKLVEALQRYREVTLFELGPKDPAVFHSSQTEARAAYDALLGRMPQLTVEIEGANPSEVSLTIDGKPVPQALIGAAMPVNPGKHALEGRHGQELASGSLSLREGDKRKLTLAFHPEAAAAGAALGPASATAPDEVAATETDVPPAAVAPEPGTDEGEGGGSAGPWILIAAGGAAAAGGGVLLGLALSANSEVKGIEDDTDLDDIQSEVDRVPLFSGLGIALIGTGAAAVVAGIVWQVSLAEGDAGEKLSLRGGPGSLALTGAF